ncbi:MAG: hydrogen peroxide-inducible genes activator [Ignavibacteriae bacterium]|nr:hydrogen peroxide-inducible genes activator [Ignavibacteriota bacterium]MCB0724043.1 hydrogen peroxide-inducible genes activator [Ignavibacteriota bacterium]MCB9243913.1 hydrogen peroxide-inducible genes activator [Ignavibacteriales bacterium]
MTIQQLSYIIAVDTYKNFKLAAEKCFVTQPTLSMQILSLEKEFGVKIFDRTKKPVIVTDIGRQIVDQARIILAETGRLEEIISEGKNILEGEIKLGIIPTLAPYLLPLFLQKFVKKYPAVKIVVNEFTTDVIIEKLKKNLIDAAVLATPLNDSSLQEYPLFYEQFVVYTSKSETAYKKQYLLAEDLNLDHLWLLEEGHCLRSQILNLCELRKQSGGIKNIEYQAGSIETLMKMVELNEGITILPELALNDLTKKQLQRVRHFRAPAPVREISMVTHRSFAKTRLLKALSGEIVSAIPEHMRKRKKQNIISLTY